MLWRHYEGKHGQEVEISPTASEGIFTVTHPDVPGLAVGRLILLWDFSTEDEARLADGDLSVAQKCVVRNESTPSTYSFFVGEQPFATLDNTGLTQAYQETPAIITEYVPFSDEAS